MFFPGVYGGGGGGLSNGAIINGVANFWQTAKPLTRIDGSALVAGDTWYKPDDRTEWFWNGTYWVSAPFFLSTDSRNISGTTTFFYAVNGLSTNAATADFILTGFKYKTGGDLSLHTVSNHWNISLRYNLGTDSAIQFNALQTYNGTLITPGIRPSFGSYLSLNNVFSTSCSWVYVQLTPVGSPPSMTAFSPYFIARSIFV